MTFVFVGERLLRSTDKQVVRATHGTHRFKRHRPLVESGDGPILLRKNGSVAELGTDAGTHHVCLARESVALLRKGLQTDGIA